MGLETNLFNPAAAGMSMYGDPYGVAPPPEWQAAIEQMTPGLNSIAQAQTVTPSEDWITTIGRAASTVFMADSQRRLLNIQMDRARQGLPPLDSSQYGMGVSVGLSQSTEKMIVLGIAAVLGVMLLMKRR